MFRKAAIVLALAASFLGAQAMDLPKPMRELTNKNKTKSAKPNTSVKTKAKTAELCVFLDGVYELPTPESGSGFISIAGATVYDCADVNTASTTKPASTIEPIGKLGATCAALDDSSNDLALCQAQLTLNTESHKTDKTSSLASSFWADAALLDGGILSLQDAVVTGTSGAFGKVDNIQSLSLTRFAATPFYKLSLTYKGRGWNPAYYA